MCIFDSILICLMIVPVYHCKWLFKICNLKHRKYLILLPGVKDIYIYISVCGVCVCFLPDRPIITLNPFLSFFQFVQTAVRKSSKCFSTNLPFPFSSEIFNHCYWYSMQGSVTQFSHLLVTITLGWMEPHHTSAERIYMSPHTPDSHGHCSVCLSPGCEMTMGCPEDLTMTNSSNQRDT